MNLKNEFLTVVGITRFVIAEYPEARRQHKADKRAAKARAKYDKMIADSQAKIGPYIPHPSQVPNKF